MFGKVNQGLSRQKEQSPNQMTKTTGLVALKTRNSLAVIKTDISFDRSQLAKTLLVLTQIAKIAKLFLFFVGLHVFLSPQAGSEFE